MRGPLGDLGVDRVAVGDHGLDELPGQSGRHLIALALGQMALEDRVGGALAEVGLEDRLEDQLRCRHHHPVPHGGYS